MKEVLRICFLSTLIFITNYSYSQTCGASGGGGVSYGGGEIKNTSSMILRADCDNNSSNTEHMDFYVGNAAVPNYTLRLYSGNGHLAFPPTGNARKIVLWQAAGVTDNYQFQGFGTGTSILKYQIPDQTNNHVFYAGTGSSSEVELMRLQGLGNLGLGTGSSVNAKFHVKNGFVLFDGTTGSIPSAVAGAGTRMMWVPAKGAFRAGSITGTQWDDANVGSGSVAFGSDNKVSGVNSFSSGYGNTVSGRWSSALGNFNTISSDNSFIAGRDNIINIGAHSSALVGANNTIAANYAFASGQYNTVNAFAGFTSGFYNTLSGSMSFALGSYTQVNGNYSGVIGSGDSDGPYFLTNNNDNSLMVGFRSNLPTLYVSTSQGYNTTGTVAVATTTIPTTAPTASGYKFVVAGHSYLNGSVVIGDQNSITQTTKFPAGYGLYVTEGILAKKVKVSLPTTSAWADFVFDKDYKLMPLDSVESYIKENKHLPEVPSAQEAVNNGVNLLEMDAKLLQKVEELTLYMIEQKKELEVLKGENKELREEVKKLSRRKR